MPPTGPKPPRWAWHPSLLEGRFASLASGLICLIPFWHESLPTDVVTQTNLVKRVDDPTFSVTDVGVALSLGLSSDEVKYPSGYDRLDDFTQGEHTILSYSRPTKDGGDNQYLFSNGTNTNFWWALIRVSPGTFRATWDDDVTRKDVLMDTARLAWHVDVAMRRTGLYRIWSDGVAGPTVAVGNNFSTPGNDPLIGSPSYAPDIADFYGDVALLAVWDRSLTDEEVQLVSDDPYGLLRPALLETEVEVGQTVTLGIATETDTVPSITPVKPIIQSIGLAVETDTALTISPIKPIIQAIGLAEETDTVPTITPVKPIIQIIGLATETDTVPALIVVRSVVLGIPTETDTALTVTPIKPIIQTIGLVLETDFALTITPVKPIIIPIGLASETDTTFNITAVLGAIVLIVDVSDPRRTFRDDVVERIYIDSERSFREPGNRDYR